MNKFKTKIRKGLFNNKSSVEATSSDAVFMLSVLLIMRNQALDHYLGKTLHKWQTKLKVSLWRQPYIDQLPNFQEMLVFH